jgi:hypothetical protein
MGVVDLITGSQQAGGRALFNAVGFLLVYITLSIYIIVRRRWMAQQMIDSNRRWRAGQERVIRSLSQRVRPGQRSPAAARAASEPDYRKFYERVVLAVGSLFLVVGLVELARVILSG